MKIVQNKIKLLPIINNDNIKIAPKKALHEKACLILPKKASELEIFWHVFSIHKKHDIINQKTAVMTLKARRAYRDSKTGEIKNIEKRMFRYNLVVFLESLDDLYHYDFSALRYKKRDLTLLKNALQAIGVNAEEFLDQYYY